MNACRDYISHKINDSKKLNAVFNFSKIHLMSHWVEQIRPYGALQLYSAQSHQQAHKTNLKDSWNASNHNLDYLPQVITFQRRILCCQIRELSLQARAQHEENIAAVCKGLPSGADLAAPLGSQSYATPKFMGPRNRREGKPPDAMFKDFRALLDNIQGTTHSLALYSGIQNIIQDRNCNKTYISDDQLHAMELCIQHGIQGQVEGLDCEHICQMCRCTGRQSWRRGDQWNDCVCVKQRPERCYSALNGRLSWQLQRLFKIKLLNKDGAFAEYWLALALTTIPENAGNLCSVWTFVQVRKTPVAVAVEVFRVRNIVSCTDVIPEIATSSKKGDRPNERWIVNSHIDLATWCNVYK
jgi:hypothetical protein